ncbi:MAG: DNA-directed DNA polymerase II small subunit, partial [Candidatus Bathyarchaeia archaeon]
IERVINAGYQLDVKALELLKSMSEAGIVLEFVANAIAEAESYPQKPLFLSHELLLKHALAFKEGYTSASPPQSMCAQTQPFPTKLEIVKVPKEARTGNIGIDDLHAYFRDRYSQLSEILKERSDTRDALPLANILRAPPKSKMKAIVFVSEKRTRKNAMYIEIEDLSAHATILVTSGNKETFQKAQTLILDQVVCVELTKMKEGLILANDFITPDIPERPLAKGQEEVYAVLISDTHVGSSKFLQESFIRLIRWLRGETDGEREREIAMKVKYLVIAGDLVDGIGVYPRQEAELDIKDVEEQYSVAGKLLSKIPENVEIILIPGNHDATSQALPQPPIPDKFVQEVTKYRKIISLPNPSWVKLHGIEFLVYHGSSLNDIIGALPEVTYQTLRGTLPIAMRTLLKVRHLAPTYGGRTPIIATGTDDLVIDKAPDILHCGHVHVACNEAYRGTLLINSGCWQAQTSYQERVGVEPTPGIAMLVNLKDLSIARMNFA